MFFFFKQKTAYEMRISDWSSDVCSSDLIVVLEHPLTRIDYIKRVIGLPGDTIALRNGELSINGKPVKREVQPMLSIPVDPNLPGPDSSLFRLVSRDARGEPVLELPIVRETLPGGATFEPRSEERRVGKGGVSPCRYRCAQVNYKKKERRK